jgi:DNA modification methylase
MAAKRSIEMTTATVGELKIEHVSIDSLRPDPANPRRIGERELESLTRSLQQFGFVQPVLARKSDNVVIGGHQRLVAARRLGWKTVPVVFLDLSPEQARLLNLALNRISGDWDQELLARMLADLKPVEEIDLSLSGFSEEELGRLLKSLDARDKRGRVETFDLQAAWEEAQRAPGVTCGDIWRLGDHRVLCGDATDSEAVSRLVGAQRASMAFTDPPYNVDLGHHGGASRAGRRRTIANDVLPPAEWEAFCRRWAKNLLSYVDGALYICMSTREWPVVSRVLEELGGHWSDTIIWAKDRFVLGRADYQRQYEPIWFGWREGVSHHWCGDRDQGDVWSIPRPAESELHPTMKPLALVERAIENSSRAGDRVLDLFLGSGTTVIAAERTGRICYGMELDAHYCRIVIARWEAFTGLKAEKLSDQGR